MTYYIGSNTFLNSQDNCDIHIVCNGRLDVECTEFPSDVSEYRIYLLEIVGCGNTAYSKTAYFEWYSTSNNTWNLLTEIRTPGGINWNQWWLTIITNGWKGKMRARTEDGAIKEWMQGTPCIPNWQCEPGYTGYESDGCGNRQPNISKCSPCSDVNTTLTVSGLG